MTRVAVVMMQKNEASLLKAWLVYHGYLFGFENLYVYDNGSDDDEVIRIARQFADLGVNFDYRWSDERDYERKAELTILKINELKQNRDYQIFFPIDADEFVLTFDDQGLSCSREKIHTYLSSLVDEVAMLRIHALMYNIPGYADHYYAYDLKKVFFAQGIVQHLEHGNHKAITDLTEGYRNAQITYLHLHNKSFNNVLNSARQKLKHRVDISSVEKVLAYRGHGDHLTKYFSMSESDYLSSFEDVHAVFFREFSSLLDALGASRGIVDVCRTNSNLFENEKALPTAINPISYLQAHPDVRDADVPPLLHYYTHGHREGRRLTPLE